MHTIFSDVKDFATVAESPKLGEKSALAEVMVLCTKLIEEEVVKETIPAMVKYYNSPTLENLAEAVDGANDCNGIKLYGADNKILDCLVYNIATDAIWYHGYRTLVQGCNVHNVSQDGRLLGDCCQAGDKSDYTIIQGNLFDHRTNDAKQCIYFENSAGTGRESFYCLIQDNICYGFESAAGSHTPIYAQCTDSIVRRNYTTGGAQGISVGIRGLCHHNVVIATVGVGIQASIQSEIYYNTIIQTGVQSSQTLSCGIRNGSSANYATIAKNNLIVGFYNSIYATTSVVDGKPNIVESYNALATQGTAGAHYRLDGNVKQPSSTDLISTFATAATTFGYDSTYRPLSTSPLLALADPVTLAIALDKDYRAARVKLPVGAYIGALE